MGSLSLKTETVTSGMSKLLVLEVVWWLRGVQTELLGAKEAV